MTSQDNATTWRLCLAALLAALLASVLRLAWLCDDALITFRSVENLIQGYGPVWNVDERVQTYTHPLWFWLLALTRWTTGECAVSAVALGGLLSATSVGLLWRLRRNTAALAVAVALLLGSRTWSNFATSGLETSLVYVLATTLAVVYRDAEPDRRLRRTAIVVGLMSVTRLDLLVLGGPALAAAAWRRPRSTALRSLAVGFAPLAAWSAFATIYYGSPFPVTAYAKAFCHGVPAIDLLEQGLRYVGRAVTDDPTTPLGILLGALLGARHRGTRALSAGVICYTLYAIKVGGDFMLGRFFLPSFALAVALVATARVWQSGRSAAIASVIALGAAFIPGLPEPLRPLPTGKEETIGDDGIVDEHRWYYYTTGLLSPARQPIQPGYIGERLQQLGVSERAVAVVGVAGSTGLGVGDKVHLIDPWLCDPLLMRLPVGDTGHWRIGHFFRRIPRGFLESVASGENKIPHPSLARAYDAVRSITRDPVFSSRRWRELWYAWTGALQRDVDAYVRDEYYAPPRDELPLSALSNQLPAGSRWYAAGSARSVQPGGLNVQLGGASTASRVVILATADTTYHVRLRRAGETIAETRVGQVGLPLGGMVEQTFTLPAGVGAFDSIWIDEHHAAEYPAAACVARITLIP